MGHKLDPDHPGLRKISRLFEDMAADSEATIERISAERMAPLPPGRTTYPQQRIYADCTLRQGAER